MKYGNMVLQEYVQDYFLRGSMDGETSQWQPGNQR